MTTLEHDERLAVLLEDLTRQQQKGNPPDIDQVIRANPEMGSELREMWAIAQFAHLFAKPAGEQTPPFLPSPESVASLTSAIPHTLGDYELIREIGRGGMGVVWKAHQKSLNRFVAIKMIRDPFASESDRSRFRAEAETAAKLRHPGIVTVHEVGEWQGRPYFVMEYVDGQTLAQKLAEVGRFTPREAARLLAQVARAMQHAHDMGLLHRDLKPSNILLTTAPSDPSTQPGTTAPGRTRIADFGLAKRLSVHPESMPEWRTMTGAIVGTPSYMAPEQASARRDLTPATDIYSLGAILYELLTGRPPFQAANQMDTLLLVLEQEPVPPRWFDPAIDRDLEMICMKCLQKPPELRYGSSAELAADLEAFVAGETISSSPSGLSYFMSRMLRETHHIGVLENWGLLWIWHSLMTFLLCLMTQVMAWRGVEGHLPYLILWSFGLITWGSILWQLRRREGPVLFVERQIAHAWAAGVCASIGMFIIEVLIPLPVLTLSPAIAVSGGMVFVFKAGILSGRFYLTAALMFATAALMPLVPDVGILLFGIATALGFLIPGIKYYRLRKDRLKAEGYPGLG